MPLFTTVLDVFLHLDQYLATVIERFGSWTYALLFLVVFLETGLVVMPFLPGDSLLFVAGALAALGSLQYWWLVVILLAAAISGDTMNYWSGYRLGPMVFAAKRRWLNEKYLREAERFYQRHGGKTIILARFIPIMRTFAPFVAGIGQMKYRTFLFFNISGALLWVFLFTTAGYFFGTIPAVQERFHYVILGIIVVSLMPAMIRLIRHIINKWQVASRKN